MVIHSLRPSGRCPGVSFRVFINVRFFVATSSLGPHFELAFSYLGVLSTLS